MSVLEVKNISFSYHNLQGEIKALSDVSFSVDKGEFIAIVGPSGCGKTTLLSILAGLLSPEQGEILFPENTAKPAIGYMLQHDYLLEWRTVYQNILLGPEIHNSITERKLELADTLLKEYGLEAFKNKKPSELSGGMRQRAALIRTLLMEPNILLLDEPFSALDYQTRLLVSADICNLIRATGKTMIIITHDLAEAISIADKILVLSPRPSQIKSEIPVHLTKTDATPLAARNAPEFQNYYSMLWEIMNE